MERYCGRLKTALRSRANPWANLSNWVLHKSYIEQVDIYYDLHGVSKGDSRLGEVVYPHCEYFLS